MATFLTCNRKGLFSLVVIWFSVLSGSRAPTIKSRVFCTLQCTSTTQSSPLSALHLVHDHRDCYWHTIYCLWPNSLTSDARKTARPMYPPSSCVPRSFRNMPKFSISQIGSIMCFASIGASCPPRCSFCSLRTFGGNTQLLKNIEKDKTSHMNLPRLGYYVCFKILPHFLCLPAGIGPFPRYPLWITSYQRICNNLIGPPESCAVFPSSVNRSWKHRNCADLLAECAWHGTYSSHVAKPQHVHMCSAIPLIVVFRSTASPHCTLYKD
ncbi:hypothetical protein DEU56DRAFT_122773 [Suillus clintonianus]|uniref:uncharacterized protein n=1 Tax=Suillus clintonianus TaxID=1904413 RepID=UPI001B85C924|nr:uncharacterized protein DEU56DRAFT_122773 [Suillus clintonianus]KAG2119419.1 hypothetical protein DEU56DRAFT_122773 [Suillus clintonianus]